MAGDGKWIQVEAVARWLLNTLTKKPWGISIEVTHNCTADCRHCDKGEKIANEKLATPEEYLRIYKSIRPVVVQISGGEPLLRPDVLDIIKILRNPGHLPFIVFVTNASLLTEEKYEELKEAGVHQFSISLDFPDERHDENRKIPGLFNHLSTLIPKLTARGNCDINMLTAVTRENYPHLMENLRLAESWGSRLNLSMYTAGRTEEKDLLITSPEDLAGLRKMFDQLNEARSNGARLFASEEVLDRSYQFYANGAHANNCKVGIRCLVVNPDGTFCPCAMKYDTAFKTAKELQEKFSKHNECSDCYISMRANTEKPLREMLRDVWRSQIRGG